VEIRETSGSWWTTAGLLALAEVRTTGRLSDLGILSRDTTQFRVAPAPSRG